jgi:hypothetical protein
VATFAWNTHIDPRFTKGVCRKRWNPDVIAPGTYDLMAEPCWKLHSYAAGVAAEELAFGSDDGRCEDDRAQAQKAPP